MTDLDETVRSLKTRVEELTRERDEALHLAEPKCDECGRVIPPEDPTSAQMDVFLNDDSTRDCGACSLLWLEFMFKMFWDIMREKTT